MGRKGLRLWHKMGLGLGLQRKMGLGWRNMIRKSHKVVDHVGGNIWHMHGIVLLNILILVL